MKLRYSATEKRARWEALQQRGQKSFIWRRGVLGYGLFMFILMTVLPQFYTDKSHLLMNILVGVVIWPTAGAVWGWWMWHFFEKKYRSPDGSVPGPPA